MGQGTHGLMFGIRAPERVILRDDDVDGLDPVGNLRGLLDLWEEQRGGDHLPYRAGIDDHIAHYTGDNERLLGVWIGVGASGIDDVPDLDATVPLSSVEHTAPYAARLEWAREEWARFATWAKATGLTFEAPELWLTTLEVS